MQRVYIVWMRTNKWSIQLPLEPSVRVSDTHHMTDAVHDPWAAYRSNCHRALIIGAVLVCITAFAISQAGIVVMLVGLGAIALALAGIREWFGASGQRKRMVGVTILCAMLLIMGGAFGLVGSILVFGSGFRLFGIYQAGTLPPSVVDSRAGWRFCSVVGGAAVTLAYGTWALQALHVIPLSVIVKGAAPGLLISLGLVPFIATFREFDERWTFFARCALLVAAVTGFGFLHDVLPGAYVSPAVLRDYEVRAELWAFTAAIFAGLTVSAAVALPTRGYFRLRRGPAREFGTYLYVPHARRRQRARARANAVFSRQLRRTSLAPDTSWIAAAQALTPLIDALQLYTRPTGANPPPAEVVAADAVIIAANRRTVADFEQLARILQGRDSDAFVAWKMRFETTRPDSETVAAMRSIARAAGAERVAPPRYLSTAIRVNELLDERERWAAALRPAPSQP